MSDIKVSALAAADDIDDADIFHVVKGGVDKKATAAQMRAGVTATPPTGTGYVHVTDGVQDGAAVDPLNVAATDANANTLMTAIVTGTGNAAAASVAVTDVGNAASGFQSISGAHAASISALANDATGATLAINTGDDLGAVGEFIGSNGAGKAVWATPAGGSSILTDPGQVRINDTPYVLGDRVSDNFWDPLIAIYECTTSGTSGTDTLFNIPGTTADGSVVWTFLGYLPSPLSNQQYAILQGNGDADILSNARVFGIGNATATRAAITDNGNADVSNNATATIGNASASAAVHAGAHLAGVSAFANDATGATLEINTGDDVGAAGQFIGSDGAGKSVWQTPLVRNAAGVPSGAPTVAELPIAVDTTAITGGAYVWTGAAWLKISALP